MGFALEVRGVRVGYAATPVLDGVTLEVGAGEWLAVAGPNGSGKTTLLRTLSGYLRPQAGWVRLEGTDLAAWRPTARARRWSWRAPRARTTPSRWRSCRPPWPNGASLYGCSAARSRWNP